MGVYSRARRWYDMQNPDFRRYLDAFAEGMNQYAEEHEEAIAEKVRGVLPVDAVDVLAHTQRVIHFEFVASSDAVGQAREKLSREGSNAWAIGPSRTDSENAMLLINPHLSWSGDQLFYEAHFIGPGLDFYGTTLVGFPVPAIGFSDSLGWSHTVNTFDGADSFELELKEDGYLFDDEVRQFEQEEDVIKIRQENGSFREEPLVIRHSVHGPVIAESEGKAIAYRVVGLDEPRMLEQWWDMARARSLEEFESILERLQVPMFNVIYADADGHILYVFNGQVPKRYDRDFMYWYGIVPGDESETLWTDTHSYGELPRIADPKTGWLQNANDPPWTATVPSPLDPGEFPSYMAPSFMHFRAQQSASLLANDEKVSFDELIEYKHWTRMLLADRLLDDLIPAAREHGNDIARAAADVLERWDRKADADSKGAVLFERWAQEMNLGRAIYAIDERSRILMSETFVEPWNPRTPLSTPDGLANPAQAATVLADVAEKLEEERGSLSVAWGDVYRLEYGGKDLPANGGPGDPTGLFRTAYFAPGENGKMKAVAGDTFYAVVEFAEPLRARVLLSYGNSTQPGSPHMGDQLELFAKKEMRTPWLDREEIEAHLESRKSFEE
jgi:acyl-homoserine-lactone acylase